MKPHRAPHMLRAILLLLIIHIAWPICTHAGSTGTAIWAVSGSNTPRYNAWNGSTFTGTSTTVNVGQWRVIAGAEAPTRDETILLGVDMGSEIDGLMWSGSGWSALSFNPLAHVSESFWWGFDLAYEQRSGRAMLVWNNGSGGSKGLSYAVWDGIAWTAVDSITTPQPGEPQHMHLAAQPNSDEMVLVVSNSNSQDYALVWNGSTWGNGITLDATGSGDDRTDICVGYEQQSGRAMVTYGDDNSTVYFGIWDGASWSGEDSVVIAPAASGNVRWTTLDSDPQSNRIALGVLTSNQDIWLNVWDGSAWATSVTATNSAHGTVFPGVAVAFEGLSGEALATYCEGAANVRYRTWTSAGGWSVQFPGPVLNDPANSMTLTPAVTSDRIMLSVQDDANSLGFVQWSGDTWGAANELTTNTGDDKNQPFVFLYDISYVDLAVGIGVSTGAPAEGDTIVYSVTVSNSSDDTATNVQLTDTLPTGVTHVFDSTTRGTYTLASGLWDIGTLPDSASATLVIRATVDLGTSGTKIANRAFVSQVDQTDQNPVNDTAEVSLGVKVSPLRFAEGTYLGNGAPSRAFTNLDFSPDLVLIKGDVKEFTAAKTATMSGSGAKELGENKAFRTDAILSLDDSGFTVGGGALVNAIGESYYWMAFQASPGQMAIGSYPGNGQDNVSITAVGFQPDYVMVTSGESEHSIQRLAGQAFDDCFEFRDGDPKHDRIQAFEPDGFQIGHDNAINKAGVTYHYAAFKNVSNRISTGNYVGTGIDPDSVTTVGFAPEFVLLRREGGSPTLLKPASQAGDNTLPVMNDFALSDAIQALLPNGFEVGQDDVVNKAGDTYYWVAFKDNQPPVLNAIGPRSVNEGQNLNFGVSATDPDGDSVILIPENVPVNATFVDNLDGTGTFDFNPDYTQAGLYNVRFIASDGGLEDTEVVAITVNHVNVKPNIDPIGPKAVDEGQNLNFGVSATDIDSDSLVLTAENLPTHATFVDNFDGTGTFDFNPDFSQAGVHNVRFIASDGSLADTEVVAITVNDVNRAPALAAIGPKSVDEGQNLNFAVSASDPDGTTPGLAAENVPANASFLDHGDGTGTFDFNPDFTQAGVHNVRFIASDGSLADTEVVAITVNDVNRAPTLAAIGPKSVDEGQNLNFGISATDPDGTIPGLVAENVPANASFLDNGDGTGTFDFDPDFTQAGVHNVRFIASDGSLADSELVAITVNDDHTVYYVSTTGDDSADGLSAVTAWQTIDNGDNLGIITPGDTVIILPGLYSILAGIELTASGTAARPVVYRASAPLAAEIDLNNAADSGLYTSADHLRIEDLKIGNAQLDGVVLGGDSCVLSGCYIHTIGNDGIELSGHGHLILRNFVANIGNAGVTVRDFSTGIHFYGNTIYNTSAEGIYLEPGVTGCRVVNNIFYDTYWGIWGPAGNRYTFNCHWIWDQGQDGGGAADSAGKITANPLFADAPGGDFSLLPGSPALDRGLDQGYSFLGSAPEMGADESNFTNSAPTLNPIGPKVVDEGQNLNFLVTATDPDPPTPMLVTDTILPANASFVDHGDGSGTFDFNPDFTQAGVYNVWLIATDGGFPDSELVTITVNDVNLPPQLVVPGPQAVDEGQNLNFDIAATDPDSAIPALTAEDVPANATFVDHGDGTGTFDFNPDFTQAGVHSVRFIASDGSLADTEVVTITVNLGPLAYTKIERLDRGLFGDTTLTTDNDSTALYCRGYTAGDSLIGDVEATWTLIGDPIGSVLSGPDTATSLTLVATGTARIVATDTAGHADTTGVITCVGGIPNSIVVSPNTATLTTDDSLQFTFVSLDADGNPSVPQTIVDWYVLGGIGTISRDGLFDPTTVGAGRIMAIDGLHSDTTDFVFVTSGLLNRLVISPDESVVGVGDSIPFVATGYDADANVTAAGDISWRVLGAIGQIDTIGQFVATRPGEGLVSAHSSLGPADTTGTIEVDELLLTVLSLGTSAIHPQSDWTVLLAVTVENYFQTAKALSSLLVRDASRGPGVLSERLANIDSVAVFRDVDHDSLLSPGDTRRAAAAYDADSIRLNIGSLPVTPGGGQTLFFAVKTALQPRDGDTLDLFMVPGTDIETADSTIVVGPDSANSFGALVIDGMIAGQITTLASGVTTIGPGDSAYHVLTVILPPNGYQEDTLIAFSVRNAGTATPADVAAVSLYQDDGDHTWGGTAAESYLGDMVFTGSLWSITGIDAPVIPGQGKFYVTARVADFPANLATFALEIPVGGVQMASANDGPLDVSVAAIDTFVIATSEELAVRAVPIPARDIVPGQSSGPLLGLELVNRYSVPVALDSLSVALLATDPEGASPAELFSQIDSLLLYQIKDGDFNQIGLADTLAATATISDGVASFQTTGLVVPAQGGTVNLAVVAALSLTHAKNGNLINVGVLDSAGLFLTDPVVAEGAFPLSNDADFTIDAFPARAVTIHPVDGGACYGGQADRLMISMVLPANGYAEDTLYSLRVSNGGDFVDAGSVLSLRLWHDLTGDGFTADDPQLGALDYNASFWSVEGLHEPIGSGGLRLLVTADIADQQFEGGIVELKIVKGGIEYWSGATGPDDEDVPASAARLVLPSNRLTAVSVPAATHSVAPGTDGALILTFALYNGYAGQTHMLRSIRLDNSSRTRSGPGFADQQMGQVSLYLDADNDRLLGGDSLISAGFFASGRLLLSGLSVHLPPESLSYFFVTVDVPLVATDADSLSAQISSAADLTFTNPVIINGDLPLSSGAYLVIDGSRRDQYAAWPVTSRTLTAGDTSVPVLAFSPARNGDQVDTLESLRLENLLDADSSDLSVLALWLDSDADTIWQGSDSLLGSFAYSGSGWDATGLELEVGASVPILFVTADVAAAATPDVAFQASIPMGGCQYSSDNDGPLDLALVTDQIFTVSNSGLRIAHASLDPTYSVGQPISVRATVTNVLATPLDSVRGALVLVDNPAAVRLDSASVGPVDLPAGAATDFVWHYTALQPGQVYWRLRAESPSGPDSSAVVQTHTVTLQSSPAGVSVRLVNSIPAAVTRGQANVFPLSVRFAHPDTLATSATLRLDSLCLHVESGAGAPIPASDVFSRIVLAMGAAPISVLESVPSASSVWLVFTAPVRAGPGETRSFSLLVDIDSGAIATDFALALEDAASIPLADENTLVPVSLDPGIAFPLRTASCRLDNASQQMAVSYVKSSEGRLNYGQQGAHLLKLYLRHPGGAGSSQIQLSSLQLEVHDALGAPITLAALFDDVRLVQNAITVGRPGSLDDTSARIELSLPITLSPGQVDSVSIAVSLGPASAVPGFELVITDSAKFEIRDLSSGSPLAASTDTVLASGLVFPVTSGWVDLQYPAAATEICMASALPTSAASGIDSMALIDLALWQPAAAGFAGVRVYKVDVEVRDSLGAALDPTELFDRTGVAIAGGPVWYQPFVEVAGGGVVFRLTDTGVVLAPGSSLDLTLVADLEADAPYDHFGLRLSAPSCVSSRDATDTTALPGVVLSGACTESFPFATGFTAVFQLAGRPQFLPGSGPARLVTPGQLDVPLFKSPLDYSGSNAQADVSVHAVRGRMLRRTATGTAPAAPGLLFDAVRLLVDGLEVASDTALAADSIVLALPVSYTISSGTAIVVELRADLCPDAPLGNYAVQFDDSTCVHMTDDNFQATVYPVLVGASYPVRTPELSVSAAGLAESFTNYPNPFSPGTDGATTLGFSLSEAARIDLEIFSITGRAVRTVVRDDPRAAGTHQTDRWFGRNDRGVDVIPGTYLCQLTARFASGRTETSRRRIALVR